MRDTDDAAAPGQWELAAGVRVERTAKGWAMVGGSEDDDSVGLRLVVHHPDDDNLIRRVEVVVPVTVGKDGRVEVGEPRVV